MSKVKIIGNSLKNIPWQERPQGCQDVIWRHDANPIINWNPTMKTARVFNSAVIPLIEKAKELLHNKDSRVSEVAGKVGYGDGNYFTKLFKKSTGVTPSEYREMLGQ